MKASTAEQNFDAACRAASALHAGLAAELILSGQPWAAPMLRAGSTDLQLAERVLAQVTEQPYCPRAHGLAQLYALRDLVEHWDQVEAVAARLMARPGEMITFD